jgi:hypothetical protein
MPGIRTCNEVSVVQGDGVFHQAHVTVCVCISENISLDCEGGGDKLNFLPLLQHTPKVLP